MYGSISMYSCQICEEKFRINENYLGGVDVFTFSCNTIIVGIHYQTENFSLSKRFTSAGWITNNPIWINDLHNINFDFSNKEKIYNKLKTYMTMS
jgi:hypothetical protein